MNKHTKKFIVNTMDLCGGLRLARFINKKKPIVLMYHRVSGNEHIPGTTPEIFDAQMSYISANFNVVTMSKLVELLAVDQIPDGTLAITFDDGHKDFYEIAWSILKKYHLTATIFLATGFVDKEFWLWPDLLKYILLTTGRNYFELKNIGKFNLNDITLLQTWSDLGDYCLKLTSEDRWDFIHGLSEYLEVRCPTEPQHPFDSLNWNNLIEMKRDGLDVGSHTVTHPILSSLNKDDLKFELYQSKLAIEKNLNTSPKGFCYPNGMPQDFSEDIQMIVKEYYDYAVVAYPEKITKHNLFTLGRYGAPNDLTSFKTIISGISR